MTIKIEIEVPSELVLKGSGAEYLDRAAGALGFARSVSFVSHNAMTAPYGGSPQPEGDVYEAAAEAIAAQATVTNTPRAGESEAQTAVRRERGKPSQGRARRTKEEIAEDEAADAADAAKQQAAEEADLKDDVKLAVSTGEERIGPDDEQDAADEAAETEKTGLASIDVLRRLVGDYQKKHGMPAAVKLCQEGGLIGKPIHELDDAGIEAAIAAMQVGSTERLREAAAAAKQIEDADALEPKTKDDLMKAMGAYAAKFDGYVVKNYPPSKEDADRMTFTLMDCPRIFAMTFGDSVQKLSQVPEDKYAEAVAAVEAAIEADPFGRAK